MVRSLKPQKSPGKPGRRNNARFPANVLRGISATKRARRGQSAYLLFRHAALGHIGALAAASDHGLLLRVQTTSALGLFQHGAAREGRETAVPDLLSGDDAELARQGLVVLPVARIPRREACNRCRWPGQRDITGSYVLHRSVSWRSGR